MKPAPRYVVSIVHFCAPNDRNGNPRRTFVAFGPFGDVVGAWREGYSGTHAVPEPLRELAARAVRVSVAPQELRELAAAALPEDSARRYCDASRELRRRILARGRLRGF